MKKIVIILTLIGFNHCFGVYESKDIINAIKNNDKSYFEKAVMDEAFDPYQVPGKILGYTALSLAIFEDRKEIFDLLLQDNNKCKKINVNQEISSNKAPLLALICKPDKKYYVEQLLNHKEININKVDNRGASALFYVVCNEKCHVLVPLFLKHPNINLGLKCEGKTIYQYAKKWGYTDIAKDILNAQITLENKKKQTNKQEELIDI
jgi:ankyrin repeat protein